MLDNLNSNFESSKAQRPDANDDEVEIDLLEIFYALKKKILLVLMVALVGGCIAAAYTQFLMTPIYSSTSSILVLSKETTLTSLADLQLGASLTSDYTVLITSTPVMEQVISDLDLDMTAEQLKGSVSINNPTDTRILEITVNNTDSKMAKKIVDEIANVSSSFIGDKMEVIPPKIIEVGKIATVRTSPSVKKNAALGFLLGFLACAAIVVVYAVMDDTIKTEEDIETLRSLAQEKKVVAIGEIGLDYYWDISPREVQKKWFERQLELAREVDLPVIIHSREAAKDTMDIMREAAKAGNTGVIHCYSYAAPMAKEYISMGFFIGIGGVLTFKNARVIKEVASEIPLSSIVLETDSPYMAPEPNRGKRNDSRNIKYVAEKLAQIKGLDTQEVIDITNQNARRLLFAE